MTKQHQFSLSYYDVINPSFTEFVKMMTTKWTSTPPSGERATVIWLLLLLIQPWTKRSRARRFCTRDGFPLLSLSLTFSTISYHCFFFISMSNQTASRCSHGNSNRIVSNFPVLTANNNIHIPILYIYRCTPIFILHLITIHDVRADMTYTLLPTFTKEKRVLRNLVYYINWVNVAHILIQIWVDWFIQKCIFYIK